MATDKSKNTSKTAQKEDTTAMQVAEAPGALVEFDYGEDAGAGFEHQTAADTSIPFIILLQAGSPQVKARTNPKALDGNMMNTVTEQCYDRDQGFLFVPATTRHLFAKWVPRDRGGGFRGHLQPEDPIVLQAVKDAVKFGKYQMTEGDELLQLSECFYVYGAVCDEDGNADGMALMAFTSTKIKAYKKWNSRLRGLSIPRKGLPPVRPPLYGSLTRVVSLPEKNHEGDYNVFGLKAGDPRGLLQSLLRPDDPRFLMAKACKELVDAGVAKVDFAKQGEPEKEKVPF